jgi:hypothetical protein
MSIYGKEESKYKLNITSILHDSILTNTTDWKISDTFLDGTDNSLILNDIELLIEPTKIFESSGYKNISTNIEFDDGWNNIYNHETHLTVEVSTYKEPILDFSWVPIEPTINDIITYTQNHNDHRDDSTNEYYGRIDKIKIDFYNDNSQEETELQKSDIFQNKFSKKQDNIPIKLETEYWDGFEYQSNYLIKYLSMSNIPPVSDWIRNDSGICVPSFEWIANSIDLDDDINNLKYSWELYQNVYDIWNLVDSSSEKNYSYPFQFEGQYKIILNTTDSEGSFHIKEEIFDVFFKECNGNDVSTPTALNGTLRLQFGGFQLVALPVNKKVSDLVDLIASKTGLKDLEVVKVCNAAPGANGIVGAMLNYVPGITNKASSNNFDLIIEDGPIKEITGFWIQMLEHNTLSYIDIEWDANTGELK